MDRTATMAKNLFKRYDCYSYNDGSVRCYNSAWDNWARWLVLALIIVAAFLLFFTFSCISARRRRKMGYAPYRGTGWAAGRHGPVQYNQQPHYGQQQQQPYYNNSNNPAPPAYTPPPNQGYYGQNSSYYQGNDVELQQPQNVYGGYRSGEANAAYAPPKGPPPER